MIMMDRTKNKKTGKRIQNIQILYLNCFNFHFIHNVNYYYYYHHCKCNNNAVVDAAKFCYICHMKQDEIKLQWEWIKFEFFSHLFMLQKKKFWTKISMEQQQQRTAVVILLVCLFEIFFVLSKLNRTVLANQNNKLI